MKINKIVAIIALSAFAISCAKETLPSLESDCVRIASATLAGTPDTKVALEATAFLSEDSFVLTDGTSSATYTYDGTSWSYDRPLIWNTFPVTLTASCPGNAPYSTDQSTLEKIEAVNLLTATTSELSSRPSGGAISLSFTHQYAMVKVRIAGRFYQGEDDKELSSPLIASGVDVISPLATTETLSEGGQISTYTALVRHSESGFTFRISLAGEVSPREFTSDIVLEKNKIYTYDLTIGSDRIRLNQLPQVSDWSSAAVSSDMTDIWTNYCADSFGGGTGTKNDPYIIATAGHLALLAANVNNGNSYSGTFFRQSADIDLEGKLWVPIGKTIPNTTIIYSFSGDYYGGLHKINNMTVVGNTYNALFGYISDAAIRGIKLENFTSTGIYVAGIAAYASSSLICGCIVSGNINNNGAGIVRRMGNDNTIVACGAVIYNSDSYGIFGSPVYNPSPKKIASCFTFGTIFSDTSINDDLTSIRNSISSFGGGGNVLSKYTNCKGGVPWDDTYLAILRSSETLATCGEYLWKGDKCWSDEYGEDGKPQLLEYALTGESAIDYTDVSDASSLRSAISAATVASRIRLTSDITISDSWTPMLLNAGKIDGQGHTITVTQPITTVGSYQGDLCVGFFSVIKSGATVTNLNLVLNGGVSYSAAATAACYVGGLVAYNYGVIHKCHVSGSLGIASTFTSGSGYNNTVGGLAGRSSGTISCSSSSVSVSGKGVSNRELRIGGLVGDASSGSVYASFATGSVTINSDNCVGGGLIGHGSSALAVSGCSSTGSITMTVAESTYNTQNGAIASYAGTNIFSYCASTQSPSWCYSGTGTQCSSGVSAASIYSIVADTANTTTFTDPDGNTLTVASCWVNNPGSLPTLR